ncbi:hypothetical protein HDG42_000090 [Paraburkholderia sp. JPY171]|nr:hypothetical protein [Paraburkholderia atlantica]
MGANRARQSASPATFKREVSFEVHAAQYSDSLKKSNSESRIYSFSDLLSNSAL